MNYFFLQCPTCSQKLRFPDPLPNKVAICPTCQSHFQVETENNSLVELMKTSVKDRKITSEKDPRTIQNHKTKCIVCNEISKGKVIDLRRGVVCERCVSTKERRIFQIDSDVNELHRKKADWNIWDAIGLALIVIFIVIGVLLACVHLLLGVAMAFPAIWVVENVYDRSSKLKDETFYDKKDQTIRALESEKELIKENLAMIYEQYWAIPPDWEWRRKQIFERDNGICQKCGRKLSGSRVPFHVHHKIPKARTESNHGLCNLELVCEICHSKEEATGHHLIRNKRKARIEKKKAMGYQRREKYDNEKQNGEN